MSKSFVVASDTRIKGDARIHTNYYQGIQMGFRSWTADPKRARQFDTRALATRASRECGSDARVELIDFSTDARKEAGL